MELESREVEVKETKLRLTEKEFSLLWAFCEPPHRTWTRMELLEKVWKIDFDPETKMLDVHLSHLRKKLEPFGVAEIEFVKGEGYRIRLPGGSSA